LAAKFDGEFVTGSQTYAGGTLRCPWQARPLTWGVQATYKEHLPRGSFFKQYVD